MPTPRGLVIGGGGPPPPTPDETTFEVDFGFAAGGEGTFTTATVAAPWVTNPMGIAIRPALVATADHGPEDGVVEQLLAQPIVHTAGVGFTCEVTAPNGTWGRFMLVATGVT